MMLLDMWHTGRGVTYRTRCGIQEEVWHTRRGMHTGRGVAYRKRCGIQEVMWHAGRGVAYRKSRAGGSLYKVVGQAKSQ